MKKCSICCNYRQEDGCRWCDKGILPHDGCKAFCKRLTEDEKKRVSALNDVWGHLYGNGVYDLCDVVSKEIGIIKGVVTNWDDEL